MTDRAWLGRARARGETVQPVERRTDMGRVGSFAPSILLSLVLTGCGDVGTLTGQSLVITVRDSSIEASPTSLRTGDVHVLVHYRFSASSDLRLGELCQSGTIAPPGSSIDPSNSACESLPNAASASHDEGTVKATTGSYDWTLDLYTAKYTVKVPITEAEATP